MVRCKQEDYINKVLQRTEVQGHTDSCYMWRQLQFFLAVLLNIYRKRAGLV